MTPRRKWMIVLVVVAGVLGLAAFALMVVKDRTYVGSAPFAPSAGSDRAVAVAYYSRSGHSEAVAREIARMFDAPIARIDADYPRDFAGQTQAVADARAEARPPITVEPLDLGPARRVYLVSPTWLFGPAPPLWSYVDQANLAGKDLTLVLTGNSRYEQARIDAFAAVVRSRGARFAGHVFLERGRIFWQLSRDELLREARERVGGAPR